MFLGVQVTLLSDTPRPQPWELRGRKAGTPTSPQFSELPFMSVRHIGGTKTSLSQQLGEVKQRQWLLVIPLYLF